MWLLLVEDEKRLALSLRAGLEEEGYTVDVAADGLSGEELAMVNAYDVLIVDWRLPGQDGRALVERLRSEGRTYPILMLTALSDIDHRVAGLDAGADDYLPKPFKFEELLARLRALLRRPPLSQTEPVVRFGELSIDTRRRIAAVAGKTMELRPKEYALLEDLARHAGEVLSRSVIAERVWGQAFYVTDNVIDVTISGLRQRLAEAQEDVTGNQAVTISTVRGVGYRLDSRPGQEE